MTNFQQLSTEAHRRGHCRYAGALLHAHAAPGNERIHIKEKEASFNLLVSERRPCERGLRAVFQQPDGGGDVERALRQVRALRPHRLHQALRRPRRHPRRRSRL